MIRGLRFVGLVAAAVALGGCPREGNGHRVIEDRALADFSVVDNESSLDVLVEPGDEFAVSVAIDSNLIDRVETTVSDDRLLIRTRGDVGGLGWVVKGPHVRITMPVLSELRVAGDGDLTARDFAGTDTLRVFVSGDGDLSWEGDALEIMAKVGGAGDLRLEGSTEWLELRVSGDGDANARACSAAGGTVVVSGDGDATVTFDGDVDVSVSGDGDADVYGTGKVTRHHSGDGDIHVH